MTPKELEVKEHLESLGYTVLHKGAPDFLCYRTDKQGYPIGEYVFVEVKSNNAPLHTREQMIWMGALLGIGAKYKLMMAEDLEYFDMDRWMDESILTIKPYV